MPSPQPQVSDEAVELAAKASYSEDAEGNIEVDMGDALAAALPVIHAERDRAWREALLSDKARRALAEMVGSAYDRGSVLTLEAVIEAALDSLQVSGAKCETCGGSGNITVEVEAVEPDCCGNLNSAGECRGDCAVPRQVIKEDSAPCPDCATDKPQPEAKDQEGGARKAASRAVEEQARGTLEEQGLKPDDAAYLVALARKRGEEMSAIDTDEPPQPHTSHGDREGEG